MWLLSQRRHLIVHRRGIVDAQYLAKTGDSFRRALSDTSGGHPTILVEIRDIGLLIANLASETLGQSAA